MPTLAVAMVQLREWALVLEVLLDLDQFKVMIANVYYYLQFDCRKVDLPMNIVVDIFESISPLVSAGINVDRPACLEWH